jgi:hypothetical protein
VPVLVCIPLRFVSMLVDPHRNIKWEEWYLIILSSTLAGGK